MFTQLTNTKNTPIEALEARAERLPDKVTMELRSGDVVRMLTPGGGGWGPPLLA